MSTTTTSDNILRNVNNLIENFLGNQDDIAYTNELQSKIVRLLRPTSSRSFGYSKSAKQRLRNVISEQALDLDSKNQYLMEFDKHYQQASKINSQILNSFLLIIEPLAQKYNTSSKLTSTGYIENIRLNDKYLVHTSGITDIATKNVFNITHTEPLLYSNEQINYATILHHNDKFWISKDTELKLLSDLLYVLQGLESNSIKFDQRSESFIFDPSLNISVIVKDTVLSICELGWLFRQILTYVKHSESSDSSKGLVVQAFLFAVQVCFWNDHGFMTCVDIYLLKGGTSRLL